MHACIHTCTCMVAVNWSTPMQVMSALADRLENEGGGSQLERPTALRVAAKLGLCKTRITVTPSSGAI